MSADRSKILKECREYFSESFPEKPFVAGKTYIPVTTKKLDADDLECLINASLDMWLTSGRFTKVFESELPKWFGSKSNALLVNSGSSANLLALSSLCSPMMSDFKMTPLKKGDEVITVAAGFPTTVNPIVQNGLIPVFVDVNLSTLNADIETIKAAKTNKTKAVVLAHTLGNPYRADLLSDWCEKEGIYLIEDCCDAIGATVEGRPVGSFGDYATASFYPAHHITMGEGGAVMSKNGRLRRVAESMRDWGRDCWCDTGKDNTCGKRFDWTLGGLPCGYDHKYIYSNIGYNLKATDMQAALGVSQLNKLERFIESRRSNHLYMDYEIRRSALLKEHLEPVTRTPGTDPSWFGFAMHCRGINREKLVRYLESHQVGTRLLFASDITKQPAYKNIEYRVHGELNNTDRILKDTFWIGVHPSLDRDKINYMIETLEGAVSAVR